MNQQLKDLLPVEKLPILIPLGGSLLAVLFDAGYFWAVEINFFTLFTLSEHIVFAIQALPFVIFTMFMAMILWTIDPITVALIDRANRTPVRRRFLGFGLSAVMGLNCIALYWQQFYSLLVVTVAAWAILMIRMLLKGTAMALPKERNSAFNFIFALAIAMGMCFSFGYEIGARYIRGKDSLHSLHLKSGPVVPSRIIRAGERGVLLINTSTSEIYFIRTDEISKITDVKIVK